MSKGKIKNICCQCSAEKKEKSLDYQLMIMYFVKCHTLLQTV